MATFLGLIVSIACGGNEKPPPQPVPAPAIQSFTAAPRTPIAVGATATLVPVFTGGHGTVQPGAIEARSGDSIKVSPNSTTTYTLQVTSSANVVVSATAKVTLDTANATVGAAGAVLNSPTGATIEIPPGALDRDTRISISAINQPPPAGLEAVSPVYQFQPDGLVFVRPVKVSLPLPAGVTSGAVYWSRSGAAGSSASDFDSLGGIISNGVITAEAPHFSLAVIGPATATRTVLGVGQTTFISATTRDSEPIDFASQPVEALVQDASGNLVPLPGVAGAPGTFTISGVPNGNYLLHSGTQYLVTSTSSPDLGVLRGGRPTRLRTPVTASTLLNVSLTGLAPWQDDILEYYFSEENLWDFGAQFLIRPPPSLDDTSTSFQVDLFRRFGLSASTISSPGDHLYIAQLSNSITDSGVQYFPLTRIAPVAPFDLPSGGSFSVSANMLDVSAASTLSVDYRGTQWDAVMSDANPNPAAGTSRNFFFGVLGQPGSADDGFFSSNADLLLVFPTGSDLVIGPLSYGSPTNTTLAGNWGILFDASVTELISPVLPGAVEGFSLISGATWDISPATAQAAPMTPPIRMPVNITVASNPTGAGVPFFTADPARIVSGIGLTPTIAWAAARIGQPASGEPPLYDLGVFELSVDPTTTATLGRLVARIITPELSFSLPAGILQPAGSYVFSLFAVASTAPGAATRLATAPFKNGLDIATAGTVSSIFTP